MKNENIDTSKGCGSYHSQKYSLFLFALPFLPQKSFKFIQKGLI